MVNEGLISKREALMRIPANQLDQIFHPMISPKAKFKLLGRGLGASPGAAVGKIVFTPERAQEMAEKKEKLSKSEKFVIPSVEVFQPGKRS